MINELEMILRACNLFYFLIFKVNLEKNKNTQEFVVINSVCLNKEAL